MKVKHWGIALPMIAAFATISMSAGAATGMYATEPEATAACGTDQVVWVDLDRGRFYDKTQPDYGKSHNGGYTCMKLAHAQYRPGHS